VAADPVLIRTTWGFDSWIYVPSEWDLRLAGIAASGYAGIDADLEFVASIEGGTRWASLCRQHGLQFIPTVATDTDATGIKSRSPERHLADLRRLAELARSTQVRLLNVHSGHDSWSPADAVTYLQGVLEIEKNSTVEITHETHRRRLFHSPWQLTAVLEAMEPQDAEKVKITADLSHWVVVGSRFYDYPADEAPFERAMSHLSRRCVYIHARVAYTEGCQVPHPAAPEYKFALDVHEAWWERIWRAQQARGLPALTMPEFGPTPQSRSTIVSAYMPRLPFTDQPVADVNEVNEWMAQRLREWFAEVAARDEL